MRRTAAMLAAVLSNLCLLHAAWAQRAPTLETIAGSYSFAAQDFQGDMTISLAPACRSPECRGRPVATLHLRSARRETDGVDCGLDATEDVSGRAIGPVSELVFRDEEHGRVRIRFQYRQGDLVAQVSGPEGPACDSGAVYNGSWVRTAAEAARPPGNGSPQPGLAAVASRLAALQGRWSDGRCAARWNDWSVEGLDITFRDQSGGVDVERVVAAEPGGFRTQAVVASRGAPGGAWSYQPQGDDTIRVRNVTSGLVFSLHRCPVP